MLLPRAHDTQLSRRLLGYASFCELAAWSFYAWFGFSCWRVGSSLCALPCSGFQESDQMSEQLTAALKEVDRLSVRLRELETQRHEVLRRFHHDCVNPLGAISGFLSLLQEPQCGELNSRQRQYVQCAEKSTQSLLTLIQRASAANPIAEMQVAPMWHVGETEGKQKLPRN
jgi:signal transduction histidine kinase